MISKPVFDKKGNYKYSETTEALFWQNPSATTHTGIIDNNHPDNPSKRKLKFAENHYVYITCRYPCADSVLLIQIEDVDGELNGGDFETTRIPVTKDIKFGLCGMTSSWFDTKNYRPAHVQLVPKKFPGKKPLSWTDKQFRFTLDFQPTGLNLPSGKNHFAREFSVYPLYDNTLLHRMIIYGSERSACNAIPETADYNFDGFTDFRICHQVYRGLHDYYLYDSASRQFQRDTLLSKLVNVSVNPVNRIFSGSVYTSKEFTDYIMYGAGLTRMSVIKRDISGSDNRRVQLNYTRAGSGWERTETGRDSLQTYEEADYNFDGMIDYRVNHETDPTRHRYYLYNKVNGEFQLDTMLTKMASVEYDWSLKRIRGRVQTKTELSELTEIYEWTPGGYVITEMFTLERPHKHSESNRFMHYKLVDGKMVLVEMGGAE